LRAWAIVSGVPAARLFLTGLAASATLLVAAACGGIDSANAASVGRDDLVSELATQLSQSATLSYTATYQLAGGDEAQITQAQKPTRVAYAFPDGRLIRTPGGTIRCRGAATALSCDETTPNPADARSTGPLTTPDAVLAMLNAASVDPGVTTTQHDTTIAGHHATCLALTGVARAPAANFTVCVTAEGALGSFAATIGGKQADLALTAYSDKPDVTAFELPSTAKVTDKRK
jgi:hypothetical protein